MKSLLTTLCIALLSITGTSAQGWYATLDTSDGLPGEANAYYGELYYTYKSPTFTPGGTLDIIRITVTGTRNSEKPNGNNLIFVMSELAVYDGDGNEVAYTARSNADHNTLSTSNDGDGLPALNDKSPKTYFHSMWGSNNPVSDYHYVELVLTKKISSFSLEWSTRLGRDKNDPTNVGITLGTDYNPQDIASEFTLGNGVTTTQELQKEGQLFVLKGNAQKYFTNSSNGTSYYGSGPIFMRNAEVGDTEASQSHIMQLIPDGEGRFIIYWPVAGRFLKDSSADYNGLNGWQYSTTDIKEAAKVALTPTGSGYFEMKYDGTYNNSPITLYVGAELRDNVNSKMKTFDLAHKQYLEAGNYTQGYSLPIAFNWNIYKANVSETTSESISLSIKEIATMLLGGIIEEATQYLTANGDFGGYCYNDEDGALLAKIDEATALTTSSGATINDVYTKKEELLKALSAYLSAKLNYYIEIVNGIASDAEFTSYPNYRKGTYPESSRDILASIQATIENVRNSAETYTAADYQTAYSKIEQDIKLFESTMIKEDSPSNGGNSAGGSAKELLCVYLSNGDIDMYELSDIDGSHYTENGKLYIPFSGGDIFYYTSEEYDSCSTTKPSLPTMTSFKFNNKYNPSLHVDAIADSVTSNMHFRLNSIGKWLTASFNLSDDKAVAYVDTVLQVSKETRQSFKNGVTYNVTYPGYNLIKRVKVQDEVWSDPSENIEITEVHLTADMLSTNKPSINTNEGVASLLDGDPTTIFHSTWGSANNETLYVNAYITIDLPEQLEKFQIYYKGRNSNGYNPKVWEIYANNGGDNWTLIRTLDYIADGMPTGGAGQEYTSPTIDLGGKYSRLKILQTMGENGKNHLAISELRIYKVKTVEAKDPEKIQDAVYENRRIPYGNEYFVDVEWLTETSNSVPRIDIDIEGGQFVTSKDYYLKANFRITGFGIYDNFEDSVEIKGRGNTSWGQSKKPYRLKFAEKVKPFGLTKGKSWVLLANAQRGSLMANAISMKIGQMSGAAYTNHIVPVELYMNGRYMGSYMFTEKVGMANNSVDVDEDLGYLLELDSYYDETYKFRTDYYQLPVNVKEPDLTEYPAGVANSRFVNIKSHMNKFCEALAQGNDIEQYLDMEAYARFFLANDLSLNQEIGHPKSTFLFRENENSNKSKLKFGPIWDFDWGYGYENSSSYCYYEATTSVMKTSMSGYSFLRDLTSLESFKKHYYRVWTEFMENNPMEELADFIDSYYTFAESSFYNNTYVWGSSCGFTESDRDRHKSWIETRIAHIYNNLDKYDIDDLIYTVTGDVNCNNQVTVHDAALVTSYLNGLTDKSFSDTKADCDNNGMIDLADARMIAETVSNGDAPSASYWYATALAMGEFSSSDFVLEVGDVQTVNLNIFSYDDQPYKAIQFDMELPGGIELTDMQCEEALAKHNFTFTDKGANKYRVVAYSDDDETFTTGDDPIINLILMANDVINEDDCLIKVSNAYVVDDLNNELRLMDFGMRFTQKTGIGYDGAKSLIEGGDCITITVLEDEEVTIYGVDGRKFRSFTAKEGTTRVEMPAGVYIVNGEKVVVK